MKRTEQDDWDFEITPAYGLLDFKLRDLWHYRDLLFLLVRRDFVSFYKQTILGPIWFFIQPIITIIFYSVVFGDLAGISTDGIDKPVFYLAGTIVWNYFSDCLTKTSNVFRDSAALMGKVYFPRLIMPLSIVASNLIRFGVQVILFIILLAFFNIRDGHFTLNLYALLFPVLILLIAAQGLGVGMMISAITTKYRDIAFVVNFGVPLLMYATTVIYPLSVAEAKFHTYSWIVKYNPITSVIETFRYGFLGKGDFSWWLFGYCTGITLVLLLLGTIVFNKVEKNFIDTV